MNTPVPPSPRNDNVVEKHRTISGEEGKKIDCL